jgi:polar amino acid transport system substrate-binding protein
MLCQSYRVVSMHRRLALFTLRTLLSLFFASSPALASTVLEKVAKTGVLTAGTSKDAFPFAYDKQGQLTGYSVEMLQLISKQLEQNLKRPIKLELVALAPQDRIPKLLKGEVDIVCDFSSFTWQREAEVDFSVSYGITGTRLLIKRGASLSEPDSLVGKRIGTLPGTTNELAIRKAQPQAEVVLFGDRAEAYTALQQGKIDAVASDDVLLEEWVQNTPNGKDYQIASYPYSTEGVACMLPENNSKFQDTVNYALIGFMQGFLGQKQPYLTIFDRWFGPKGASPLTLELRNLMLENMRLVIDSHEELPESSL